MAVDRQAGGQVDGLVFARRGKVTTLHADAVNLLVATLMTQPSQIDIFNALELGHLLQYTN
jgi:hypothetical protein